jgi:hypothetical protein
MPGTVSRPCVGKRLEQHNVDATSQRKIIEMNRFDSIAATSGNNAARQEMKRAMAERALDEIGMRPEKVRHVMAGRRSITIEDVDAAMRHKAEMYAFDVNESRRRSKNKYFLEDSEKYAVEPAYAELWPTHKSVRLKNDLAAAGIIA